MDLKADKSLLIVICGPTAAGKTRIGIDLAKRFESEIISADSRQFYKEMSIGTAKPSDSELSEVPHHFINNLSVSQNYSVGDFEREALDFLEGYFVHRNVAFLIGGSGLYINAVIKGLDHLPEVSSEVRQAVMQDLEVFGLEYLQIKLKEIDPEYYAQVDLNNPQRVVRAIEVFRSSGISFSSFRKNESKPRAFNVIKIGISPERETLYQHINLRVEEMLKSGLVREVKSLIQYRQKNALQTVGYKEVFDHLDGKITLMEAAELIKRNSRRYAKRQLTWFRRDPDIKWFDNNNPDLIFDYINEKIKSVSIF